MAPADEKKTTTRVHTLTLVIFSLVTVGRTTTASITDKYNGGLQLPVTTTDEESRVNNIERLKSVHKRSVDEQSEDTSSQLEDLTGNEHIDSRPARNFMRFGRRVPETAFNCYPILDRERLMQQLRPLVAAAQNGVAGSSIAMISAYDNRKRFMRFGKRFMRFGRSGAGLRPRATGGLPVYVLGSKDSGNDDYDLDGADSSKRFMRFGKRFMRFGRSWSPIDLAGDHVTNDESSPSDQSGVVYRRKPVDMVCFAGNDDVLSSTILKLSSDKRFMRFGRKSDVTPDHTLAASVDGRQIDTGADNETGLQDDT